MRKVHLKAALALLSLPVLAKPLLTREDLTWVVEIEKGGQQEVRLGNLAASKAAAAPVRDFGRQLASSQARSNKELQELAGQKRIRLSGADSQDRADYERLAGMSGAAFDREFLQVMLRHQEDRVVLFEAQAAHGSDRGITAWAAKLLLSRRIQLEKLRRLRS